jgi:hypothetical protein
MEVASTILNLITMTSLFRFFSRPFFHFFESNSTLTFETILQARFSEANTGKAPEEKTKKELEVKN